jgi:hypothetical protein
MDWNDLQRQRQRGLLTHQGTDPSYARTAAKARGILGAIEEGILSPVTAFQEGQGASLDFYRRGSDPLSSPALSMAYGAAQSPEDQAAQRKFDAVAPEMTMIMPDFKDLAMIAAKAGPAALAGIMKKLELPDAATRKVVDAANKAHADRVDLDLRRGGGDKFSFDDELVDMGVADFSGGDYWAASVPYDAVPHGQLKSDALIPGEELSDAAWENLRGSDGRELSAYFPEGVSKADFEARVHDYDPEYPEEAIIDIQPKDGKSLEEALMRQKLGWDEAADIDQALTHPDHHARAAAYRTYLDETGVPYDTAGTPGISSEYIYVGDPELDQMKVRFADHSRQSSLHPGAEHNLADKHLTLEDVERSLLDAQEYRPQSLPPVPDSSPAAPNMGGFPASVTDDLDYYKDNPSFMADRYGPAQPGWADPSKVPTAFRSPEVMPKELPDDAVSAFVNMGETQRGAPELAMLAVQDAVGGGVLNPLVEHVGDLTHRMTHMMKYGSDRDGLELLKPKIRNQLNNLRSPYGFEREMRENVAANVKAYGGTEEARTDAINAALAGYAKEHKKLPVYNRPQWLAREAAVAVGEKDWAHAERLLAELDDMTRSAPDFNHYATQFERNSDGSLRQYIPGEAEAATLPPVPDSSPAARAQRGLLTPR